MKKIAIFVILISIILISGAGCQQQTQATKPFCKSPYIEFQKENCCLDENNNNICDNDEENKEITTPKIVDYEIIHSETRSITKTQVINFKMKYDTPIKFTIDSDDSIIGWVFDAKNVNCWEAGEVNFSFAESDMYYQFYNSKNLVFETTVNKGIRDICLVVIPQNTREGNIVVKVEQKPL